MLLQFSVENFLSFDEEQVFSMVASSDDQHSKHLVPNVPRKGKAVLRAAAIYGANGAGKSNLVSAMLFAQSLIRDGSRSRAVLPVRPFKLSADSGKPSKFEFTFKAEGIVYNYGFRLNSQRILEEWLYATPKTQEVKYFERTSSEDGKTEVEFGPSLKGKDKERSLFLKFTAQSMTSTQLFLSKAVENNIHEISPILNWLINTLLILQADSETEGLGTISHMDGRFTNFLEYLLKATGTGIDKISTCEVEFNFDRQLPNTSETERAKLREAVATLTANGTLRVQTLSGEVAYMTKGKDGQPVQLDLIMMHRSKSDQLVEFSMTEESEGTQRLINLAAPLFTLRTGGPQVLVLDELDRRLHTHLSRFFIKTALECDDHGQSQLIFTTHDTNILDLDLLRRDEIWFVEKDQGGASHLYSLAEFKIRPDLKVENGYLNGRFGAIPFIGDLNCLGLAEEQEDAPVSAMQVAA